MQTVVAPDHLKLPGRTAVDFALRFLPGVWPPEDFLCSKTFSRSEPPVRLAPPGEVSSSSQISRLVLARFEGVSGLAKSV